MVWMQFPACAPALLLLSSLDGSQPRAELSNDARVYGPITRTPGHLSDLAVYWTQKDEEEQQRAYLRGSLNGSGQINFN